MNSYFSTLIHRTGMQIEQSNHPSEHYNNEKVAYKPLSRNPIPKNSLDVQNLEQNVVTEIINEGSLPKYSAQEYRKNMPIASEKSRIEKKSPDFENQVKEPEKPSFTQPKINDVSLKTNKLSSKQEHLSEPMHESEDTIREGNCLQTPLLNPDRPGVEKKLSNETQESTYSLKIDTANVQATELGEKKIEPRFPYEKVHKSKDSVIEAYQLRSEEPVQACQKGEETYHYLQKIRSWVTDQPSDVKKERREPLKDLTTAPEPETGIQEKIEIQETVSKQMLTVSDKGSTQNQQMTALSEPPIQDFKLSIGNINLTIEEPQTPNPVLEAVSGSKTIKTPRESFLKWQRNYLRI